MAYLNYVSPPSIDWAANVGRAIFSSVIGVALAAADPAPVAPVAEWLALRPTTLVAALLGSVIFVLLTEGRLQDRLRRAVAAFILACLATDKTLEWLSWSGPASDRFVALFYTLIPIILIEALIRRLFRRADAVADGAINLAAGRIGVTLPPDPEGGDHAK